jgi:hypothetical protein
LKARFTRKRRDRYLTSRGWGRRVLWRAKRDPALTFI